MMRPRRMRGTERTRGYASPQDDGAPAPLRMRDRARRLSDELRARAGIRSRGKAPALTPSCRPHAPGTGRDGRRRTGTARASDGHSSPPNEWQSCGQPAALCPTGCGCPSNHRCPAASSRGATAPAYAAIRAGRRRTSGKRDRDWASSCARPRQGQGPRERSRPWAWPRKRKRAGPRAEQRAGSWTQALRGGIERRRNARQGEWARQGAILTPNSPSLPGKGVRG